MSKKQKKDKYPDDSRLTAGNIIADFSPREGHMSFFMTVRATHDEIAVIRLFTAPELTDALRAQCYMLRYDLIAANIDKHALPLYADCRRLMIKDRPLVVSLLDKYPERLAGSIDHHDLAAVMELTASANTISEEIKNKYLS